MASFHKADYVDLLSLLYYFTRLASTKGAMALEAHIEKPAESPAFQKFPKIIANHHASTIICDYLRMVGMNADDPHQVDDVMGRELKKTLAEELHPSHAIQAMADALPALGIVAAVLGVIKTMSHINEPPAVLGAMIGGALVGTFLGVLMAYGMAGPVAARMKSVVEEEAKYLEVIRAVLVTHLHGNAPQVSVTRPDERWPPTSTCRPSRNWRRQSRPSRCRRLDAGVSRLGQGWSHDSARENFHSLIGIETPGMARMAGWLRADRFGCRPETPERFRHHPRRYVDDHAG